MKLFEVIQKKEEKYPRLIFSENWKHLTQEQKVIVQVFTSEVLAKEIMRRR